MSIVNEIENILHKDFKCREKTFEEPEAGMSIDLDTNGCQCLIYKYDKQLGRQYKGGLFPFFAKKEGVCKISDYIVFAERNRKLYCLVIELKRGKSQTLPQLKAAKEFVKYVVNTLNRVTGKSYNPIIRLISIHEIKLRKQKTQVSAVKYDSNSHYDVKFNNFLLKSYLV